MTGKASLTRRVFLIGGGVLGGVALTGLGVGVGYLALVDVNGQGAKVLDDRSVNLTAWINIAPDNTITIYVPFLEMGQGTHTGLAQLVGEELGLDLAAGNVRVVHPSEDLAAFANWTMMLDERPEQASGPLAWVGKRVIGALGAVATGGSTAMVGNWTLMREAGAVAREMLKAAAAAELGIHPDHLMLGYAGFGTADGREVKFGEIAEKAARLSPPSSVVLKSPAEFELIGKPIARVDVPAKVRGSAVFGLDVRPEGLLFAALRLSPKLGGKVASVGEGDVRGRRGVVDIVRMEDAVAVIADNSWRARQAVEALDVAWSDPAITLDSAAIVADLEASLKAKAFTREEKEGDFRRAVEKSMATVTALYRTPFLAHATMEPMNATIRWGTDDRVEVWAPTQSTMLSRSAVKSVGPAREVAVHVTFAGGGFGRRAETDFITHAARVALAVKGRPVQTFWTREEDMRHDTYRPASVAAMAAALDGKGQIEGLSATIAAPSLSSSYMPRNVGPSPSPASDRVTIEGLQTPYLVKSRVVAAVDSASDVPLGFWRSVGHSHNGFYMEAFIDECAATAGIDPMEFRRMHLAPDSRHARVLERLAKVSNWTGSGGNGHGRGIALHESFRSVVGAVVDVTVSGNRQVRIEKVVIAADCGRIVNPQLVEAQMQGGFLFGLTAAVFGKIDIVGSEVVQGNFPDYEMLRLASAPAIEVSLIDSDDLPGGVGEPGTPPAAPALVNAIFAATGERVRSLPVSEAGFRIG
ncbi:MAG: molybdopterin cofactor-binding domain-containing protein [Hyphomicrobiales bacterium]